MMENAKLLLKLREEMIIDIHHLKKQDRLMKPFTSLLNKIIQANVQSKELYLVAAKLHERIASRLPQLNVKYLRDRSLERERI